MSNVQGLPQIVEPREPVYLARVLASMAPNQLWDLKQLASECGDLEFTVRLDRNSGGRDMLGEQQCTRELWTIGRFCDWCESQRVAISAEAHDPRSAPVKAYLDYCRLEELLAPLASLGHEQQERAARIHRHWASLFGLLAPLDSSAGAGASGGAAFWLSSLGALTRCHYDTYGYNVVVGLEGTKRWRLWRRDRPAHEFGAVRVPYEESTVLAGCEPHELPAADWVFDVQRGDVLVVPWQCWHEVTTLSPAAASVNVWIDTPPRDVAARVGEAATRALLGAFHTCQKLAHDVPVPEDFWLHAARDGQGASLEQLVEDVFTAVDAAGAPLVGRRTGGHDEPTLGDVVEMLQCAAGDPAVARALTRRLCGPVSEPGAAVLCALPHVLSASEARMQYYEIAHDGVYSACAIEPGAVVLDVGANVGSFAAYAAGCGAGRVVCFEPVPASCAVLRANAAWLRRTTGCDVHVIEAGVGAEADPAVEMHWAAACPGEATRHPAERALRQAALATESLDALAAQLRLDPAELVALRASRDEALGTGAGGGGDQLERVCCRFVSLRDALALVASSRVDLLKMDVEGDELELVRALGPALTSLAAAGVACDVRQVACEVFDGVDGTRVDAVVRILRRELGFADVRMRRQRPRRIGELYVSVVPHALELWIVTACRD